MPAAELDTPVASRATTETTLQYIVEAIRKFSLFIGDKGDIEGMRLRDFLPNPVRGKVGGSSMIFIFNTPSARYLHLDNVPPVPTWFVTCMFSQASDRIVQVSKFQLAFLVACMVTYIVESQKFADLSLSLNLFFSTPPVHLHPFPATLTSYPSSLFRQSCPAGVMVPTRDQTVRVLASLGFLCLSDFRFDALG